MMHHMRAHMCRAGTENPATPRHPRHPTPTVTAADLDRLAGAVARLSPSHRDPEAFHVSKSEVVAELRRLARTLGGCAKSQANKGAQPLGARNLAGEGYGKFQPRNVRPALRQLRESWQTGALTDERR